MQELYLARTLQHHHAERLTLVRRISHALLDLRDDRLGLHRIAQPGRRTLRGGTLYPYRTQWRQPACAELAQGDQPRPPRGTCAPVTPAHRPDAARAPRPEP